MITMVKPSSLARKHGGVVIPGSIRHTVKISTGTPVLISWGEKEIRFSTADDKSYFVVAPALYDNILPVSPEKSMGSDWIDFRNYFTAYPA